MKKFFYSIIIILSIFAISGCSQVDLGEVGVKTEFGKIVDGPLKEGLYFYTWFGQDITAYNIKNQTFDTTEIVFSKDVQEATMTISLLYNLDASKLVELHKNTGIQYQDILIKPNFADTFKNVAGKWEATDMVGNREKLSIEVYTNIVATLKPYGINVQKVNITNIDFKDAFEAAVEEKQVALQKALKAKNDTVRIKEEAEQKLLTAEAEAKAMTVRAKALEQNKSLVEYEAVMKWNGELPEYMMGNTVPFINIGDIKK